MDISCQNQTPFLPSDNRDLFCAAMCESGRRCRNRPIGTFISATLVINMSSCCKLCATHKIVAEKKLVRLITENGLAALERGVNKLMGSGMEEVDKKNLMVISDIKTSTKFTPPNMEVLSRNTQRYHRHVMR